MLLAVEYLEPLSYLSLLSVSSRRHDMQDIKAEPNQPASQPQTRPAKSTSADSSIHKVLSR